MIERGGYQGIEYASVMRVLLAEDSDSDAELLMLALEEAKASVELTRVENGDECLRYLRKQPPYQSVKSPDILILDINMPVKNGLEVMREVMEDPALRSQPVIVLSTSDSACDIDAMYGFRCNAFAKKPSGYPEFVELMKTLMDHWNMVILPTGSD